MSYSAVAVKRFVRRVQARREPRAARRRRQLPDRQPARRSRRGPGLRLDARAPARPRSRAPSTRSAAGARVRGRVKVVQPKVTTADLADKYPQVVTVDRAELQAAPVQEPEAREDLQDRRGPGRARDPGRPLPRAEQGGEPRLARPQQRLGRRPGRQGDPRRRAREPAQVALARDLRRRRHPRHRRDLGSLGTAASHGCIRMAIPDVEELYDEVPVQAPVYIQ